MVIDTYFNDIYTYDSILSTLKMDLFHKGHKIFFIFMSLKHVRGKHSMLNDRHIEFSDN